MGNSTDAAPAKPAYTEARKAKANGSENKGEPIMLKTIISYTRYTMSILATVGFGLGAN
jgi:hypothetical protein